ncbi:Uncharacterised protein [Escherichia coli]|uniref:Transcriptional regulator n=1 Tax=Escherichia coli TaxID=562 RepID=A0A376WUP9_ECOLX|nr:Uncharacterised protein [Escherichia coli]
MSKPTDEEIVRVLEEHGRCMTYVVTNWLRDKYRTLKTAYVLASSKETGVRRESKAR